jgi:acyl CoA:acetate/3-ketoacid CoA transferase beta subunit
MLEKLGGDWPAHSSAVAITAARHRRHGYIVFLGSWIPEMVID